jgi:hypothetical protein
MSLVRITGTLVIGETSLSVARKNTTFTATWVAHHEMGKELRISQSPFERRAGIVELVRIRTAGA